ncbi:MAG: hypothetical protein MUC87_20605 [Bacteroidia bacterium]|jgi:uncharacterized membrane protein YGL010W|nr:hypothetical protein [Bacteroidia bacterium]
MSSPADNKNSFWLSWTINCALGELIGIGAAGVIAILVFKLVGEPQTTGSKLLVLLCMMCAGLIEGAILGYMQWRILRHKLPELPRSNWMQYTMLIAVLGWMLGMMPSLFFMDQSTAPSAGEAAAPPIPGTLFAALSVGVGLFLGALFGLFQWFELRHYVHHSKQWILANALGWGAGIGWIYFFAGLPEEHTPLLEVIFYGVCGGILAGLSVGAITGAFLVRLHKR